MIVNRKSKKILVADIGGTNARFAAATVENGRGTPPKIPQIDDFASYSCADFHEPQELIEHYLNESGHTGFDAACFAVAGPALDNAAYLTNLGWTIKAGDIEAFSGIPKVTIANDFEALARSVTALDASKMLALHQAEPMLPGGPVCVMGPGTGFGLAQVIRNGQSVIVVPTEGGHSSFVPHGNLETRVWAQVKESMGRITVETLLSGIGILRIYRAICSLNDTIPLNYEPSTISQRALEENDAICVDTLQVFCSMLGGVASDVALTQGAIGGVYLGGGILPKIAGFVQKSKLMESFLDKPPMEEFIAQIPVNLITDPEAALTGACLLADDRLS